MGSTCGAKFYIHESDDGFIIPSYDSPTAAPFYTATMAAKAPQVAIFCSPNSGSTADESRVGQVTFPPCRSDIRVSLSNGKDVEMVKAGPLSSAYEIRSPGTMWTWEKDGALSNSLRLFVTKGRRNLANMEMASSVTGKKTGTLTILEDLPQHTVDAIVITGLARLVQIDRAAKAWLLALGKAAAYGGPGIAGAGATYKGGKAR